MVVGLTGGIGSGKSTVLNFFKEFGVQTFIADEVAKRVMKSNRGLKNEIIKFFGEEAYVNNELNKTFIASLVFTNKEKLRVLNNLVHPVVSDEFDKFKTVHKDKIIIYEAAILFESGNSKKCNFIITVTSNYEDRISRLIKRDVSSYAEISLRMKNQLSDDYKIKRSHFVINNSKIDQTKVQTQTIYRMLCFLTKKA